MQRLLPRILRAGKPPRAGNLYPLSATFHGPRDRLLHRTPMRNTPLHLMGNVTCHQISIKLRLPYLLNIEPDSLPGDSLQEEPHFINSLPSSADNDSWPRRIDGNRHLIGRPFDLNARYISLRVLRFDGSPDLEVLLQKLSIVPISIPLRLPILGHSESKTYWMNFLPHLHLLSNHNGYMAGALEKRFHSPSRPRPEPFQCPPFVNKDAYNS